MMIEVFREKMIKVSFEMDRCGCLVIKPLSKEIQDRMVAHMQEYYSIDYTDADVFINDGFDKDEYMRDYNISKSQWRDLERGWKVTKLVDKERFAYEVGYDFHNVI